MQQSDPRDDFTSGNNRISDETLLRLRARQAMQLGKLPNHPPASMWGGPGTTMTCAVCGTPIGANEMEFELQFSVEGDQTGNPHVHLRCFAAWESEREVLQLARATLSRSANDHLQHSTLTAAESQSPRHDENRLSGSRETGTMRDCESPSSERGPA